MLEKVWVAFRRWPAWVQVLLWIVFPYLFLLLLIWKGSWSSRNKWVATGAVAFIAMVFIVASTLDDSPDGQPPSTVNPATQVDDQATTETEAPFPKERLQAEVEEALGESNRDVPRISELQIPPGGQIYIEWAIDDNLTEGLVKDTARLEATEILEVMQATDLEYKSVVLGGTFLLVDKLGNESEDRVVLAKFRRSLIERINFDNFIFKNVFELDDSSFVHPAFQY